MTPLMEMSQTPTAKVGRSTDLSPLSPGDEWQLEDHEPTERTDIDYECFVHTYKHRAAMKGETWN
jgi:hypothetical protein